ncbi:HlyD family efflux transporter periplasmic adaptor subunit [Paraburkholderia sp. BL10I2N1]|uniref:HlyD family secretion protein n=1 Tax=Paraburkholderia sp. BL10I2N1 TaxID=1938796 RepID=UPI00105CC36E|nr:HlyD family efflux transporter periplasmic adaptor subunit [Paraburkholderia sp. BL10I2N1]TDN68933.1 membrane fusion protein [Paraburkholderia sp. BL10I2N1]
MEPINLPQFHDISWRWIAYATSALVTIGIAFAFFHEVELKQDVRAEIVSPAEIKIQGLSGLVSDVYVHPSTPVTPGAPLFRLERNLSLASDGRPRPVFDERMRDEQVGATKLQYKQRRAELAAQLETSRLTEQSRRAEIAALDEQTAQNRQLMEEAGQKLARLESVSGYVTADRIEQARADTHQARVAVAQGMARRQQLQAARGAARSTQAELDAQLKQLEAKQARDLQDIHMRFEENRQNATISAPKAGVVTFSGLVPGRTLAPTDVALVIATGSGGPLRAALRIPSRRRGFVREGQIIRLKFDAFPYAKFGSYEARIDSISRTTVRSPISPSGASEPANPEGDYMAWATLAGNQFNFERRHFDILPGMGATASIVIERRTIAEWVLAPLYRMVRG